MNLRQTSVWGLGGVNRSKRKNKELGRERERERERERAHRKTSGAKSSKIPKLIDLENPLQTSLKET